ncbi:hypothetical protein FGAF1022_10220 [Escherichia coli]|nr:hypothetical protein FGAF1022_10220 [Escherichia coli]
MSYQYVNVVTINKVAVIEFNYGRKLNALSKVGNDSNLLIVFYVQIMPDDFVMQLHRF